MIDLDKKQSLKYFTPKQVAELTGFSLRALEAMRSKRTGPCYTKIGNAKNGPIRYCLDDVRNWMQENREVTNAVRQR